MNKKYWLNFNHWTILKVLQIFDDLLMNTSIPYNNSQYVLIALIPMVVFAFGPSYFFSLNEAHIVHHLHGVSSSLWLLLLIAQSWLATKKNWRFHRMLGLSLFFIVPFMVGSFALVSHLGAIKTTQQQPFYVELGTALLTVDIALTFLTPWLVYLALKHRRSIHLHSALMLSTIIGLLGPIISRIFVPLIPGFQITGPDTLYRFNYSIALSAAVTLIIVFLLYLRDKKHGWPWLLSGGITILSYLAFISVGETAVWKNSMLSLAEVPASAVFIFGVLLGFFACIAGWRAGGAKVVRQHIATD